MNEGDLTDLESLLSDITEFDEDEVNIYKIRDTLDMLSSAEDPNYESYADILADNIDEIGTALEEYFMKVEEVRSYLMEHRND